MPITFSDLIDEVQILVSDDSDSIVDAIPAAINAALASVVEVAVPSELKRIGLFSTQIGQAWSTMPDGFNGKLLFVGNDSTSLAIATGGVKQLMEVTPLLDEVGPVHTVALEGTILYYQGVPSSVAKLPILYMDFPTPFVDGTDAVPSYIPTHLQRGVLVHLAAATIFDTIEDGIEGDKVNTNAQMFLHSVYMDQYTEFVAKRRTNAARSMWSF